jgi:hypothetical protein
MIMPEAWCSASARQSLGRSAACEEKHQLLARRPFKRPSRIVIRVGFRWFKLYERAA